MNYNQFRWDHPIGNYELLIPRDEFVARLTSTYGQLIADLRPTT